MIGPTFICCKCGKNYAPDQDREFGGPGDKDWNPWNGHCYECELKLCYDLYGGFMEPMFFVGDTAYMPDEVRPKWAVTMHGPDIDIPF